MGHQDICIYKFSNCSSTDAKASQEAISVIQMRVKRDLRYRQGSGCK